jgi:hypothetical protein
MKMFMAVQMLTSIEIRIANVALEVFNFKVYFIVPLQFARARKSLIAVLKEALVDGAPIVHDLFVLVFEPNSLEFFVTLRAHFVGLVRMSFHNVIFEVHLGQKF